MRKTGWIWVMCGCLSFLSVFLEWGIKDRRGSKQHISFTNKQLFSGFSSLFQNKPLRNLLYGTSIQQLVFSGFPVYIVIWASLLLTDHGWLGAPFSHFGPAKRSEPLFFYRLSQNRSMRRQPFSF